MGNDQKLGAYYAPKGGLPPQTQILTDRAMFTEAYAVIPRGTFSDIVTSFLPFAALLPHVAVYVSNGGYGGVQQALAHGVPVAVAGTTEDKAEVAGRVEYAGVGLNLRSHSPTPERLRRAAGSSREIWSGRSRASSGSAVGYLRRARTTVGSWATCTTPRATPATW